MIKVKINCAFTVTWGILTYHPNSRCHVCDMSKYWLLLDSLSPPSKGSIKVVKWQESRCANSHSHQALTTKRKRFQSIILSCNAEKLARVSLKEGKRWSSWAGQGRVRPAGCSSELCCYKRQTFIQVCSDSQSSCCAVWCKSTRKACPKRLLQTWPTPMPAALGLITKRQLSETMWPDGGDWKVSVIITLAFF